MDRGQAISGKSTAKQALNNPVLKNVKAIKEDKVYNLDPKLWYFAAGSTTTTIKQIEELDKVVNNFKGEQWLKVLIIAPLFFKKEIWDVNQCPRL